MIAPSSDPSDTYLMVLAWNTSRQGRDVALELADRNREQAKPAPIDLSRKDNPK